MASTNIKNMHMILKNVFSAIPNLLVVLLSGGNKDIEIGLRMCQEIQLPYLRGLFMYSALLPRNEQGEEFIKSMHCERFGYSLTANINKINSIVIVPADARIPFFLLAAISFENNVLNYLIN